MDTGTTKINRRGNKSVDKAAIISDPFFTLAKYLNSLGPTVFANERTGDVLNDGSIDINVRTDETPIAEYNDV